MPKQALCMRNANLGFRHPASANFVSEMCQYQFGSCPLCKIQLFKQLKLGTHCGKNNVHDSGGVSVEF